MSSTIFCVWFFILMEFTNLKHHHRSHRLIHFASSCLVLNKITEMDATWNGLLYTCITTWASVFWPVYTKSRMSLSAYLYIWYQCLCLFHRFHNTHDLRRRIGLETLRIPFKRATDKLLNAKSNSKDKKNFRQKLLWRSRKKHTIPTSKKKKK